jgi:hypothetical protein
MNTLKCTECGHENEAQRVYCHSCGTRLDRSTFVEEVVNKKAVKPKRRGALGEGGASVVKNLLRTVLFAAIAAALVQAARPPVGAPSEKKELGADIVDAPSFSVEMEEAAAARRPLRYSEAQLNAYLKNRIKAPKNPTIPTWACVFDSAYLNLDDGAVRVWKKYKIFTLPVYVGGSYVPTVTSNQFKAIPLRGHIGSLPLPGMLFDTVDQYLFADFIKNMKQEAGAANLMQSYVVKPKMISISSVPAKQ